MDIATAYRKQRASQGILFTSIVLLFVITEKERPGAQVAMEMATCSLF